MTQVRDIPKHNHFAIVTDVQTTQDDGWGGTYTNTHSRYDVYLDEKVWREAIEDLALSQKSFSAIIARPAAVTTLVQVDTEPNRLAGAKINEHGEAV